MANTVSLISNTQTSTNSSTLSHKENLNKNYWYELFLDVKHPFIRTAKDVLFSPLKRPLSTLVFLLVSLNPAIALRPLNSKYQLRKVSIKNIDRSNIYHNLPAGVTIPSDERLKHLLARVDALAKKMGITKPLKIYTSNEQIPTGCVGGITSKPSYILFDLNEINLPDDQLDFVICHELNHLKENHMFKAFLFSSAVLVIDALAIVFLTPLAFLGVEAVASFTDRLFHQYHEQDCDNQAMKVLGTGKGVKDFFEGVVKRTVDLKYTSDFDAFVKKLDRRRVRKLTKKNKLNPDYMHKFQSRTTPEGNNRRDFAHPLLTRRADAGRQFLPARAQ